MAAPPRKKLRQAAEESSGKVSTLCFSCRRTEDKTKQQGLSQFFKASSTSASASQPSTSASQNEEALFCSKCRRSMEQKVADRTGGSSAGASRVLPQIARLRQYQRLAAEQRVPFAIPERAAAAIMREPCTACDIAAPLEGHGLTRLRVWPEGLTRPERGGFMGPYAASNLAPACSTCNLMKGCRSVRGCVGGAALRSGGHGPTQQRPQPCVVGVPHASRLHPHACSGGLRPYAADTALILLLLYVVGTAFTLPRPYAAGTALILLRPYAAGTAFILPLQVRRGGATHRHPSAPDARLRPVPAPLPRQHLQAEPQLLHLRELDALEDARAAACS